MHWKRSETLSTAWPDHAHLAQQGSLLQELARCDREIASAEQALRAGGKDIKGLLVWLLDWQCERKLIEREMVEARQADNQLHGSRIHPGNINQSKSNRADRVLGMGLRPGPLGESAGR